MLRASFGEPRLTASSAFPVLPDRTQAEMMWFMPAEPPRVVLVVDDDADLRTYMDRVLTARGYRVVSACDGLDGLEAARMARGQVDVLVTDCEMPRMGGLELATRLVATRPDTGVLLMSGDRRFAPRGGTWRYLAKPFTPEQLVTKVEEVLR